MLSFLVIKCLVFTMKDETRGGTSVVFKGSHAIVNLPNSWAEVGELVCLRKTGNIISIVKAKPDGSKRA